MKIIFDTDIGTDVDDLVALALLLNSPEIELAGVTCVYGDVLMRARMALKLLRMRGRGDVPVTMGAAAPLLGDRPIYWGAHEGRGFLEAEDEALQPASEFAVNFIVRSVMDNPGQIHLLCIGPLTNAALAFRQEPRLAQNLAGLTIMGGAFQRSADVYTDYGEYNIVSDPEAAHIVFSSGAPITLIPLDVTTQVRVTSVGSARIREAGTRFHQAVADQIDVYSYFAERGWTYMHDPLAMAALIRPELVSLTPLHVDVETGGRFAAGVTFMRSPDADWPENARVALEVDVKGFEEFLIERLAR